MEGISPDFANDLCPNDLDRVMPVLENAFARLPALTEVGIKSIVNGPITYSPDGLPLVGKVPGVRNAYCCIGLRTPATRNRAAPHWAPVEMTVEAMVEDPRVGRHLQEGTPGRHIPRRGATPPRLGAGAGGRRATD